MDEQIHRYVLSLLIDNETGILARIAGMFSGRGYNIDSLTVTEVDQEKKLSRITIVTNTTKAIINQIKAIVGKMVPVHSITNLTEEQNFVEREIILIKMLAKGNARIESLRLADAFGAKVVDATDKSLIFELTGKARKIKTFVELMKPLGMLEVTASGVIGIVRGYQKT